MKLSTSTPRPGVFRAFYLSGLSLLLSSIAYADDQTVTGSLTVTGTADIQGNVLTFGTQSGSTALTQSYTDTTSDTLAFFINRNPASFLWTHTGSPAAMRLNSAHELVLYKSDGAAGVKFTPESSQISLGSTMLYRDAATGALRTNGALAVDGSFSASSFAASSGTLSGGSSGLSLSAGGSNQNVTISSTGTGSTIFNGKVGIGTSSPQTNLHVVGDARVTGSLGVGPVFVSNPGRVAITGSYGEVSLSGREQSQWTESPSNGERWVLYAEQGKYRIWSGGDKFTLDKNGTVTLSGAQISTATLSNTAISTATISNAVITNATISNLFALSTSTNANLLNATITNATISNAAISSNQMTTGSASNSFGVGPIFVANPGRLCISGSYGEVSLTGRDQNQWTESPSNGERWVLYAQQGLYRIWSGGDKVVINSAGDVGIGTTSPQARLHVSGSAKVTSSLTAASGRFDGPVRIAPQGDLSMGSFTSEP